MSWYMFALIGITLNALATISRKVVLKDKNKLGIFANGYLIALSTFIALLIYGVLGHFKMPPISEFFLVFIVNIALGVAGWLTNQKGLKNLAAGEYTILLTSRIVVTWVASLVILGIGLSTKQLLGAIFISVAILVIFFNKKGFIRSNKVGIVYTLLTALIYGLAIITDQIIYRKSDPASYLLIGFGLTVIILASLKPKIIKTAKILLKPKQGFAYLLSGALVGTSLIFIFTSLKLANNAALVSGIFQLQIIITVIFGIVILKERNNMARKLLGSILAVIGAILLIK